MTIDTPGLYAKDIKGLWLLPSIPPSQCQNSIIVSELGMSNTRRLQGHLSGFGDSLQQPKESVLDQQTVGAA